MTHLEHVQILGLSNKELRVLAAVREGYATPLSIYRRTKVSRPGVYDILLALHERGIVASRIHNGKKTWKLVDRSELEQRFFETKRTLLGLSEGTSEIYGVDDAVAIIHHGSEAVRKLMNELLTGHKHEKFYGFQGDVAAINWNKVFTPAETNAFNRAIKKNAVVAQAILPEGWFERQTKELGVEWAKDFEGRTQRVNIIGEEYFKHGGQVFLFKKSIYFIALGEELIIEIRNSEIQKLMLAIFAYIQDTSRSIDANALLRKLINEKGSIEKVTSLKAAPTFEEL